jgi:NlpC/P60 family
MSIQHYVDQSNGGQQALVEAEKLKGRPYVFGGWPVGNEGTDCSGTWEWAYLQIGVSLPRTTYAQYLVHQLPKGSKLEPGDLLFIEGSDALNGAPGHVMGFVKAGEVFQAPFTGETINFYPYDTSQYLYATRPALALPVHVAAPSQSLLTANHLERIDEQNSVIAARNGWAIRNYDGADFPLDAPSAGQSRVLYASTSWRIKNKGA